MPLALSVLLVICVLCFLFQLFDVSLGVSNRMSIWSYGVTLLLEGTHLRLHEIFYSTTDKPKKDSTAMVRAEFY